MRYHLVALFTIAAWGLTFVSTKVLLVDFSPLWILAIRFLIGYLVLCALRPRILRARERAHEWLFALAGATGVAAYYLLENVALVYTTATAVGVTVAVAPLLTAIIAALRGDRSALSIRFFGGFVMAIAGLILVGVGTDDSAQADASSYLAYVGDLLALLAALAWAVYSLVVKRIGELGYETIASTKRTFFWGLVLIIPTAVMFEGDLPPLSEACAPENIANMLFLGLIASAACFVTWGIAVRHLGVIATSTYIYMVPAITAVASALMLGEVLTLPIVAGLALTVMGLVLSQMPKRKA